MTWLHSDSFIYTVFVLVICLIILYDIGLFNKSKESKRSLISNALIKTFIWLFLGFAFSLYIYMERGESVAIAYVTAFLMEWSLSVDNIFVFIILFSSFGIKTKYVDKILLIGIILAVVLRMGFIALGIAIVQQFNWIFYFFAAFLIYTGIKILTTSEEGGDKDFKKSRIARLLSKWLRIREVQGYKFIVKIDGKWYGTTLLLLIIAIAFTDITFALDSIPAVLAITQDQLTIYTSNIFAILGLRSLYFALQGAKEKFHYLPKGIGIVLVFIGLKIAVEELFHYSIPTIASLSVILLSFIASVFFSMRTDEYRAKYK